MRSDEPLVPWALTFAICISMPSAMQKELQDLGGAAAANQPARLAIFCAVLRWGEALRRAGGEGLPACKSREGAIASIFAKSWSRFALLGF